MSASSEKVIENLSTINLLEKLINSTRATPPSTVDDMEKMIFSVGPDQLRELFVVADEQQTPVTVKDAIVNRLLALKQLPTLGDCKSAMDYKLWGHGLNQAGVNSLDCDDSVKSGTCSISSEYFPAFLQAISEINSLTKLHLRDSNLECNLHFHAPLFLQTLSGLKNLRDFCIDLKNISPIHYTDFFQVISKLTTLNSLGLCCSDGYLNDDGTSIIINEIPKLKSLTSLKLGKQIFERISRIHFASLLHAISEMDNLTSLDFSDSGLVTLLQTHLPDFFQNISKLQNLTSLNLARNNFAGNLSDKHCSDLFIGISKLTRLTSLDLSSNHIGNMSPWCFPAFHRVITELKDLTTLNLSCNLNLWYFSGRFTILVFKAISELKSLRSLDLGATRLDIISSQNRPVCIGFLSELQNLTSLNLSYNSLEDFSEMHLTTLFQTISKLPRLTSLDLSVTRLTVADIRNFLPYLRHSNIETLIFGHLSSPDLKNDLELILQSNRRSNLYRQTVTNSHPHFYGLQSLCTYTLFSMSPRRSSHNAHYAGKVLDADFEQFEKPCLIER